MKNARLVTTTVEVERTIEGVSREISVEVSAIVYTENGYSFTKDFQSEFALSPEEVSQAKEDLRERCRAYPSSYPAI